MVRKSLQNFVTSTGRRYAGIGLIRARRNPSEQLSIELVFTRWDSPWQFTDIIFRVSSRQLAQIIKTDSAEYEYIFQGILVPDNDRPNDKDR